MISDNYSLKKRLLKWISFPILIAAVLIFLIAFLCSWHEIEEVYDAQLVHTAKTLLQLTQQETDNRNMDLSLDQENTGLQHKYENKMAFRIWKGDNLVLRSSSAERFGTIEAAPGFSNLYINEKPWRFFVYIDTDKNIRIETSERYSIRYELIGQLMTGFAIPMAVLIPLLLLIVWMGVSKSITPIIALSAQVDTRKTDDLNPIEEIDVPREVMPLVEAMNRLFVRISDSFKREREFTDHAAHELRTPLAAMKTQTQVLLKKASSMPDCKDGLDNLNATIDRTTHLVDQLLSLARLQNHTLLLTAVNLSDILGEVIDDAKDTAANKSQILKVDVAPDIFTKGHPDSLFMLIRNILDNALKYTPEGGTISVVLSPDKKLSVSDSGPGISNIDKTRVFNRFVRVDKTGQAGSGLGLSIVQWVADSHGATLALKDNHPNGLIVDVSFQ